MRLRRTYREKLDSSNIAFRIENETWDKASEILKPHGLSRQDYLRCTLKILVEKGKANPDVINMLEKQSN